MNEKPVAVPELEAQLANVNEDIRFARNFLSYNPSPEGIVPDAAFARVKEIAQMPRIGRSDIAHDLVAIENFVASGISEGMTNEQFLTDLGVPLGEIVRSLFSNPQLKHDDESVALVLKNALIATREGAPFVDALIDAIDTREAHAKTVEPVDLMVDTATGFVTPKTGE